MNKKFHPSTEDMFFIMRGGDIDPEFACWFAKHYMKRRWFEIEPFIMTNSKQAFIYASDVIEGRWPEAEEIIKQDLETVLYYTKDVIKERWLEMEPTILTVESGISERYCFYFPEARTHSKDIPVVMHNYAIMDIPNSITDQQLTDVFKIISPNLAVKGICESDIRIKRMLFEPTIRKRLKEKRFIEITLSSILNLDEDHLNLLLNSIFPNKAYNTDFC
jgi:hypothetical protein